jgi:hypothetical protein
VSIEPRINHQHYPLGDFEILERTGLDLVPSSLVGEFKGHQEIPIGCVFDYNEDRPFPLNNAFGEMMDDLDQLASAVREQTITRGFRPATALARLGAAVADFIAVFFLTIAALAVATIFAALLGWQERADLYLAIMWATAMLYSAAEILADNSFGKGIAGIVIALPDGTTATRTRLFYRWLIKYSFLILLGMSMSIAMIVSKLLHAQKSPPSKSTEALLELIFAVASWAWLAALFIVAVGSIGMFFPKGRTLHDWLAGTTVFNHLDRARKPPPTRRAFAMEETHWPLPNANETPAVDPTDAPSETEPPVPGDSTSVE